MPEFNVYKAVCSDPLGNQWNTIGNFTNKEDAEAVLAGKGAMGNDGYIREAVIQIFESVDEYRDLTGDFPKETLEEIKKSALAKLSIRERTVLGI